MFGFALQRLGGYVSDEGHSDHKVRLMAITKGCGPAILLRVVQRLRQEVQWLENRLQDTTGRRPTSDPSTCCGRVRAVGGGGRGGCLCALGVVVAAGPPSCHWPSRAVALSLVAELFPRRGPLTLAAVRRYQTVINHATNHALVVIREMCFMKPTMCRVYVSEFATLEQILLLWQFAQLPSYFEAAGSCIEEMLAARPWMLNVMHLGTVARPEPRLH